MFERRQTQIFVIIRNVQKESKYSYKGREESLQENIDNYSNKQSLDNYKFELPSSAALHSSTNSCPKPSQSHAAMETTFNPNQFLKQL